MEGFNILVISLWMIVLGLYMCYTGIRLIINHYFIENYSVPNTLFLLFVAGNLVVLIIDLFNSNKSGSARDVFIKLFVIAMLLVVAALYTKNLLLRRRLKLITYGGAMDKLCTECRKLLRYSMTNYRVVDYNIYLNNGLFIKISQSKIFKVSTLLIADTGKLANSKASLKNFLPLDHYRDSSIYKAGSSYIVLGVIIAILFTFILFKPEFFSMLFL